MIDNKTDLRNLSLTQLKNYLISLNLPSARAGHLFSLIHRPLPCSFHQMNDIKKEIRSSLEEHAFISTIATAAKETSRDGTVKFSFRLADGALIESVLIPEGNRHTLCVSSQVGCAMGCNFCLTGRMGFTRNLTPAEIVNQIIAVMEHMIHDGVKRSTVRELINNLVFMGMGEPLANYDNLLYALAILMDEKGLEFTERRITVSTCGIVPRIDDLGQDVRVKLAVSLHSPDDTCRNSLMPVNRTYPVDQLLTACRRFPLSKKKVILFEYILIKGINDSSNDAELLAEKLQGIPCRINLLPFNESESMPFQCPPEETILAFQKILRDRGFRTLIRSSRGADISAACGQLAGRKESNHPSEINE